MDPNQLPADPPVADQPPAWATQLTEQFNAINTKIDSFTEEVNTKIADLAPPVAPPVADPVKDTEEFVPQTWEEVTTKAKQETIQELERIEQERQAQQEQEQKAYDEQVQTINKEIVKSLDELTTQGHIPAVVDPNDKNDPGVQHRLELLQLADATGSLNLALLNKSLNVAHSKGMKFDPEKKDFVTTGVPTVPALSGNSQPGNVSKTSYSQLKNATLSQLAAQMPQ